jgi:1-acyl-sn-glycerol-3-phosphate acyltransferase
MLFKIFWRMRIIGRDNVPMQGAVILAANHVSLADPPILGSAFPRPINFMAKQELFEIPFLGWLIRQVNAFPVKREEHDIGAFKTAQRLLKSQQVLILFPEGHRSRTGELGAAKSGVGMLAAKSGCGVVPCYVHNSGRLLKFRKLCVHFDKVIYPLENQTYQEFSEEVMNKIRQLKENCCGIRN